MIGMADYGVKNFCGFAIDVLSFSFITKESERSQADIQIRNRMYIQIMVVVSGSPALFQNSPTVHRTHPGVLIAAPACGVRPIL